MTLVRELQHLQLVVLSARQREAKIMYPFSALPSFSFYLTKKKNPKCKSHVNRDIDMKTNLKLNNMQNATIGKLFKVGTSEGEIRHLNI